MNPDAMPEDTQEERLVKRGLIQCIAIERKHGDRSTPVTIEMRDVFTCYILCFNLWKMTNDVFYLKAGARHGVNIDHFLAHGRPMESVGVSSIMAHETPEPEEPSRGKVLGEELRQECQAADVRRLFANATPNHEKKPFKGAKGRKRLADGIENNPHLQPEAPPLVAPKEEPAPLPPPVAIPEPPPAPAPVPLTSLSLKERFLAASKP